MQARFVVGFRPIRHFSPFPLLVLFSLSCLSFANTDASDRPITDRPKKGKTIGFRSNFPTFQLHLFKKGKFETLTTYDDSLTNTGSRMRPQDVEQDLHRGVVSGWHVPESRRWAWRMRVENRSGRKVITQRRGDAEKGKQDSRVDRPLVAACAAQEASL